MLSTKAQRKNMNYLLYDRTNLEEKMKNGRKRQLKKEKTRIMKDDKNKNKKKRK
jgi:hypothetical protein